MSWVLRVALMLTIAGGATANDLGDCLAATEMLRVARVVDPAGRIVYARVVEERLGHVTRVATIADAATPLNDLFDLEPSRDVTEYSVTDDRVCGVVEVPESELDAEERVIVSTGLNYAAHADEAGGGEVFLFPKPAAPTSPYARVHAPAGVTLLDYEVELAFVLFDDVDPFAPPSRDALLARSAFFLSNDVSDREAIIRNASLSGGSTGFSEGKGQPGFFPVGPWMVRGTELFEAVEACGGNGLGLRLQVDDEVALRQDASTSQMILPVEALVARVGSWIEEHGRYSSMHFARGEGAPRFYPLAVGEDRPLLPAGSIVQTGTPDGVALHAPSPIGVTLRGLLRLRGPFSQFLVEEKMRVEKGNTRYLVPGQRVRAQIDGLGTQFFEIGEAGGRAEPDACSGREIS